MNIHSRRTFLASAVAGSAASALAPFSAFAQTTWPTKVVSLIVGYPPGGLTDAGARFITNGMSAALRQPVVVENKPGASGNLAAAEVERLADDHKLLVANTSLTINPHTFSTPSPNPLDFTPIGLILESQLVLCVHPSAPAKNFAEFCAWVESESKTRGFNYASAGSGGNTHLAMELLRDRAGLPVMNQIPYRGSAPAITDLVGGQVPCLVDAASLLIPFISTGKLRPILVTGSSRLPVLPDVPTGTEVGLKDFNVTVFVGLWGKPKLAPEIVRVANAALNAALAVPSVSSTIVKNGDMVGGGTPERLAKLTRDNYKIWGEIVKKNDIKAS